MKNHYTTWLICCILMIMAPVCADAYVVLEQPAVTSLPGKEDAEKATLKDFVNLSKKDLKEKLGRKLTFKEQISFLTIRKFLKNAIDKNAALGEISVNDFFQACAKIVLKNGDIIEADIIQLTSTEIKYKRCGKPDDPEFVVAKKEVLSVQAADGEIIFRNTGTNVRSSSNDDEKQTETNAIIAFIGALVFFPLGIIFGIISLNKISKNPGKYKGRGLALAGIIIGALYLLIVLIAIASV